MELAYLSAFEIGNLVNRKVVSPTEVMNYFIGRIVYRNPDIHAFTYTKFDEALDEAKKLEARIMNHENVGPFAGVPIGLKDFLPSKKGWTNSHGGVKCLIREDDADSEFYKAASKLGAIAIGKTNAPAFGFSGACINAMYGATKNPFDISRTSGGSSGGSAAAVADGLLGLSEGGDAGGSIRIPAGWCNLFGFKPSLGTVPSYCRPDGWSATHPYCFNGGLTRTVKDSAILLSEMAKYNPRDPISLPINAGVDFTKKMYQSIEGKKLALTLDFDLYTHPKVDPDVETCIKTTAKKLEDAGAIVEYVNFNWKHTLEEIMKCWAWSISVDTMLDIEQWKSEGLDLFGEYRDQVPEEFIQYNLFAGQVGIHDFRTFNEIRTDILDNFEDVFENYDAILSPTAICKPLFNEWEGRCLEVNGVAADPETNFICFGETPLANFVGYPAASVPAGLTWDLLPVGMQIIGKQYHDGDVFSIAKTIENIQPWDYDVPANRTTVQKQGD